MKILFLCTGNSCRSQIAEGYAHNISKGILEVKSAGLNPQGLNLTAIEVMREDGIDISSHNSTLITPELIEWADIVITLCGDARENCPRLPKGKDTRHWPFEDPAKAIGTKVEILEKFKIIRDGIKIEIINLTEEFRNENKPNFPRPKC